LDGINIESPSPPGSGPSLEALPLIAPLERDLGVPVVQAIAARIWEIQKA
jgi:maleate cis-trans isomerase